MSSDSAIRQELAQIVIDPLDLNRSIGYVTQGWTVDQIKMILLQALDGEHGEEAVHASIFLIQFFQI